MSPGGIDGCLAENFDKLSNDCKTYQGLVEACKSELVDEGGVCTNAFANAEGMPCLLQRTSIDALSPICKSAVSEWNQPKDEPKTLKNTFWADGRRKLNGDEKATLTEEDMEQYNRWRQRSSRRKGANSDRSFAINKQQKAKQTNIITNKVTTIIVEHLQNGASKAALKKKASKVASKGIKRAMKLVQGLKFSKKDLNGIVDSALKLAQEQIERDQEKAEL